MIDRRPSARPTQPFRDHHSPASSGPRWAIASRPATSHERSSMRDVEQIPTRPHTNHRLPSAITKRSICEALASIVFGSASSRLYPAALTCSRLAGSALSSVTTSINSRVDEKKYASSRSLNRLSASGVLSQPNSPPRATISSALLVHVSLLIFEKKHKPARTLE